MTHSSRLPFPVPDDQLRALTAAFGPSGAEGEISQVIQALCSAADSIHSDPMGNLIVFRKGIGAHKKSLLFSAHMDSVGLMVTSVTDLGYLSFLPLGGLVPADLARSQVQFFTPSDSVPRKGVVVAAEKKEAGQFSLDDLAIDIGAENKETAATAVHPGDCAVYTPCYFRQGSRIFSTYLDNRAGCCALTQALSHLSTEGRAPYNDLHLVFTVQEEVGMRGARTVAATLPVDYAFGVDVTCTADQHGSDETATAVLGGGAALKLMDHSVLCDRRLLTSVQQIATSEQIPWQLDLMKTGGTDCGALQPTGSGLLTGGISIPCRYTHAPLECMDENDYSAVVSLILALAESEFDL